jgi:DNA-binding transcriptional MerR regulator
MDDGPTYSIGELAAAADVTPRTIRYYAAEGLLPAPEMRGKYAVYNEDHLNRLRLIAQLKAAYFPLSVIKERLEALDAEQVLQALAQPQPTVQGPGSAAEYIATALAQRRSPDEPSAPPAPGAPALELSAGDDEALAEVEEAGPLRLQEEAARYEAAPAQAEGAVPEQPGRDLARKPTGPPVPSVPPVQPQRDRPPAPSAPPVQQEPVLARPAPPAAQAPAQAVSPAAAPPPAAPGPAPAPAAPGAAPLHHAAGAAPAPEEQRARGGLLGRLLPRRERPQPAPGAAGETEPERWSRVTLAPGVELHIREPAAPGLRERIARLIAEARTILAD